MFVFLKIQAANVNKYTHLTPIQRSSARNCAEVCAENKLVLLLFVLCVVLWPTQK